MLKLLFFLILSLAFAQAQTQTPDTSTQKVLANACHGSVCYTLIHCRTFLLLQVYNRTSTPIYYSKDYKAIDVKAKEKDTIAAVILSNYKPNDKNTKITLEEIPPKQSVEMRIDLTQKHFILEFGFLTESIVESLKGKLTAVTYVKAFNNYNTFQFSNKVDLSGW